MIWTVVMKLLFVVLLTLVYTVNLSGSTESSSETPAKNKDYIDLMNYMLNLRTGSKTTAEDKQRQRWLNKRKKQRKSSRAKRRRPSREDLAGSVIKHVQNNTAITENIEESSEENWLHLTDKSYDFVQEVPSVPTIKPTVEPGTEERIENLSDLSNAIDANKDHSDKDKENGKHQYTGDTSIVINDVIEDTVLLSGVSNELSTFVYNSASTSTPGRGLDVLRAQLKGIILNVKPEYDRRRKRKRNRKRKRYHGLPISGARSLNGQQKGRRDKSRRSSKSKRHDVMPFSVDVKHRRRKQRKTLQLKSLVSTTEAPQKPCSALTSEKYITQGGCSSLQPVTGVVCTGFCEPPRYFYSLHSKFTCTSDIVRYKRVILHCYNNRRIEYDIKIVRSCACKEVFPNPNPTTVKPSAPDAT